METINALIFIFSIIIIFIPVITISATWLVYKKSKLVIYKYCSLLLSLFTIDLIFLHYNDFFHYNVAALPSTFISFAAFKILLFSGVLYLGMQIVLTIYQRPFKNRYYLLLIAFVSLEIGIKMLPENDMIVWFFYTIRQVFSIGICSYYFYLYYQCKDLEIKSYAKKLRHIFGLCILLNFVIGIEDALVSFQQEAFSTSGLIFKERNFTENFYWVVIAVLILMKAYEHIKSWQAVTKVKEVSQDTGQFISAIKLTKRETEIFNLMIAHYGNAEIADKLCISAGTLKAHIHNIYGKADVTNRSELIKKFNDSNLSYQQNVDVTRDIHPS